MHLKYGLYSCRGTCQCGEWDYQAPGSFGYEKRDVQWMADAGADFLKIDSCCASQDHATAFQEYGMWRDAMNATGTARGAPIYFSICGCVCRRAGMDEIVVRKTSVTMHQVRHTVSPCPMAWMHIVHCWLRASCVDMAREERRSFALSAGLVFIDVVVS